MKSDLKKKTINEYAEAYLAKSSAEKVLRRIKPQILEMISEAKPLKSERFMLTYKKQENIRRLNIDKLVATMGQAWIDQFYDDDGIREVISVIDLTKES